MFVFLENPLDKLQFETVSTISSNNKMQLLNLTVFVHLGNVKDSFDEPVIIGIITPCTCAIVCEARHQTACPDRATNKQRRDERIDKRAPKQRGRASKGLLVGWWTTYRATRLFYGKRDYS